MIKELLLVSLCLRQRKQCYRLNKFITNKMHLISIENSPASFGQLSLAVFRECQYLKTYTALLNSLSTVNGKIYNIQWQKVSVDVVLVYCRRSQWPRSLRLRSTAARLLRSWVRIPPGAWMSICCERCVLSGRGLYDELITRPEESYRLWCVVACDLETTKILVIEEIKAH